jgi:hypothetical protein
VVSAAVRGRSNQRKGGYHECKQGKRLGELTGFTFERNLEQRREADHLGDLLCSDARWPFVIENKYRSQGNSIPAGAWEQACRTAFKSDRWPSVIWQNGRTAPRCRVPLSVIGCAQGGYELIPFGTADLSLEDYADLAMRLMGITKTPPLNVPTPFIS